MSKPPIFQFSTQDFTKFEGKPIFEVIDLELQGLYAKTCSKIIESYEKRAENGLEVVWEKCLTPINEGFSRQASAIENNFKKAEERAEHNFNEIELKAANAFLKTNYVIAWHKIFEIIEEAPNKILTEKFGRKSMAPQDQVISDICTVVSGKTTKSGQQVINNICTSMGLDPDSFQKKYINMMPVLAKAVAPPAYPDARFRPADFDSLDAKQVASRAK